jgi:hypothetical protein
VETILSAQAEILSNSTTSTFFHLFASNSFHALDPDPTNHYRVGQSMYLEGIQALDRLIKGIISVPSQKKIPLHLLR